MPLMNSFYGGRRGASFVIVKNYVDVLSMTKDFSLGNDFTEVKFDEYVLINNPYKNHPDNGKIFRRGYDYGSDRTLSAITILIDRNGNYYQENLQGKYQNLETTDKMVSIEEYMESYNQDVDFTGIKAYGAEYIGCIAGPAGNAPLLSIVPYQIAEDKSSIFEERRVRGSFNPTSDTYEIYNSIENEWIENENNNGIGLIPGKYQGQNNEVNYNDSIQWFCTSIRNDNYGDDTQAFIGFKFPYLVTQMQTSWVEPYAPENNYKGENVNRGDYTDTSEIHKKILITENGVTKEIFDYQLGLEENQEEILHPYYNKWHLNIPKGIKGNTFKNFRVTTYSNYVNSSLNTDYDRKLYDMDNNILLGQNGEDNLRFFAQKYNELVNEQPSILIENEGEYVYNSEKTRNDLLTFLGDRKILVYEEWTYDNKKDGQVKYHYLGDYNQITDVTLDEEGTITISFTNQDTKVFTKAVTWIDDIKLFAGNWDYEPQVNNLGQPIYEEVFSEDNKPVYEAINGRPVQIDENENIFYVNVNEYGEVSLSSSEGDEQEIIQIKKDENDQFVKYKIQAQKEVWKKIGRTSDIDNESSEIQEQIQNGTLLIRYNNNKNTGVESTDKVFTIPWVDKITYDEEDGFLKYKLAGQDETYPIGAFHGIDSIIQTDNELQIIYNYKSEGQQVIRSFPLKSISDVVFLEENNQFFIFARGDNGEILYNADNKPLYRTFSYNEEDQQIFTDNPEEDPNARTQTLTGIVVFYTNGDHELITGQRKWKDTTDGEEQLEEVGGGFNFLEKFGFTTQIIDNSTVVNGIEYKTLKDEEKQVADIIYPVKMYYNQNTGQISYLNSKNTSVDVGTLPIVQSIDIGENLDVYVELSNPANYFKTIDSTHLSNDSLHPYVPSTGPYWYKIGNLIQEGLTFAGVRRVFTYDQLKEAVLGGISDSTEIYNIWTNWGNQEDILINTDTIIQTLNALYPDGTNQIRNAIINSEEQNTENEEQGIENEEQNTENEEQGTENEENSSEEETPVIEDNSTNSAFLFVAVKQNSTAPSDFYAYSYDNTKNSNIDELNNSEETIIVGTWFYVGSIGDLGNPDSIFKIVDSRNSEDSSPSALTFRTPSDIHSIEPGSLNLSNPMREIKDGTGYKTTIKMNSRLSGSQTITVTMGDDTNVIATFNYSSNFPYVVNILPKDGNGQRGVYGPIKFVKV